jgi:NADH-quinone oxidoreductase subunit J
MELFFYLFAFFVILGSIGVIFSKNPVHSVLWLIFAFANSAGIFILLGAEFLAFVVIIVYVGAVAVLFLFIVMMLDLGNVKSSISQNWLILVIFSLIFIADCIFITYASFQKNFVDNMSNLNHNLGNIHDIGSVLYTDYILQFQLAGILLLAAMLGAIILGLRKKKYVKRQDIYKQLYREKKDGVALVDVKKKSGITGLEY